jgi:hypothetical protein
MKITYLKNYGQRLILVTIKGEPLKVLKSSIYVGQDTLYILRPERNMGKERQVFKSTPKHFISSCFKEFFTLHRSLHSRYKIMAIYSLKS